MIYHFFVKIRSALLVYLTHKMALPVLKMIRKPELFPCTMEQLHAFESGTLGKALGVFLQYKRLDLLPYYAKHDIKHILLSYDTTDDGEVCLQCFMLGNRHLSFPVLATVLYGFITMPEHWSIFIRAFRRGSKAASISHWQWFELLHEPTVALQAKINSVK
ncbi:MAG: hypothetical protein JWQ27_984 [Ferruginibacter sp.]|nr:hypothetical protein [Ferruginibacter sp.]